MLLGERLCALREANRLTQDAIERLTGIRLANYLAMRVAISFLRLNLLKNQQLLSGFRSCSFSMSPKPEATKEARVKEISS
jgi:transcriptional regulator with XRE-family HTH domain